MLLRHVGHGGGASSVAWVAPAVRPGSKLVEQRKQNQLGPAANPRLAWPPAWTLMAVTDMPRTARTTTFVVRLTLGWMAPRGPVVDSILGSLLQERPTLQLWVGGGRGGC